MERRRFLQLTGFSATSLLFTRLDAAGLSTQQLDVPTSVSVLSEGQWITLTGSGERWSQGPFAVELQHSGSALKIRLRAPGKELEKVKLGWKQAFGNNTRYLGDQWERSYGDLQWSEIPQAHKAPWYVLINDGRETHCFGVKTGAKTIAYWEVALQGLELVLDTHSGGSGVLLGSRTLDAATVVTMKSRPDETPFATDCRFCRLLCEKPLVPAQPVYGINDWYFAYGNNSKELILQTTKAMMELASDTHNPPFSVIDDGWETDDFQKPNTRFGEMSVVAAEIKKIGMRPGLWTRPLLARKNESASLLLPVRRGQENSKERYLDPTIPENLHRIAETFALYKEWGFEMVKHDYSTFDLFGRWGAQMSEELTVPGWHCSERSLTNAEIVLELYKTIRKASGPMYLIGCNTMSHLSAGLFELNRIGDDTSGREWPRVAKFGVNTMGFRLPQHNAFYAADGDCVGITTQIPWTKNRQWLQLLAESGAPLFISAEPEATGAEQKAYIKECFRMAARVQPLGEPLDWLENSRPAKWRLNGRVVDFDWS
jgi:alpha-galactosidase